MELQDPATQKVSMDSITCYNIICLGNGMKWQKEGHDSNL